LFKIPPKELDIHRSCKLGLGTARDGHFSLSLTPSFLSTSIGGGLTPAFVPFLVIGPQFSLGPFKFSFSGKVSLDPTFSPIFSSLVHRQFEKLGSLQDVRVAAGSNDRMIELFGRAAYSRFIFSAIGNMIFTKPSVHSIEFRLQQESKLLGKLGSRIKISGHAGHYHFLAEQGAQYLFPRLNSSANLRLDSGGGIALAWAWRVRPAVKATVSVSVPNVRARSGGLGLLVRYGEPAEGHE
jgi:hypothetical protein